MRHRRWIGREAQALIRETGQADPIAAIEALAGDLLDEMELTEPPVDPRMAASFRGVVEVRATGMTSAARLVPTARGLIIEVNDQHTRGRQHFSICHEVAHILMPTYGQQQKDDQETGTFAGTNEEEILCDFGAAALLLPDRWLHPMAKQAGPSLDTVRHLATWFGASLQATARQLARLDLWPCALVIWEDGLRKSDAVAPGQFLLPGMEEIGPPRKKLRVTAAYCAPSFAHYIPLNKSVPEESLVVACVAHQTTTKGMEVFDFGSDHLALLGEHRYVPYGQDGDIRRRVISLLMPADS